MKRQAGQAQGKDHEFRRVAGCEKLARENRSANTHYGSEWEQQMRGQTKAARTKQAQKAKDDPGGHNIQQQGENMSWERQCRNECG